MNFSVALRMLKDGYKVQRKGWGNMYITLTEEKSILLSIITGRD